MAFFLMECRWCLFSNRFLIGPKVRDSLAQPAGLGSAPQPPPRSTRPERVRYQSGNPAQQHPRFTTRPRFPCRTGRIGTREGIAAFQAATKAGWSRLGRPSPLGWAKGCRPVGPSDGRAVTGILSRRFNPRHTAHHSSRGISPGASDTPPGSSFSDDGGPDPARRR